MAGNVYNFFGQGENNPFPFPFPDERPPLIPGVAPVNQFDPTIFNPTTWKWEYAWKNNDGDLVLYENQEITYNIPLYIVGSFMVDKYAYSLVGRLRYGATKIFAHWDATTVPVITSTGTKNCTFSIKFDAQFTQGEQLFTSIIRTSPKYESGNLGDFVRDNAVQIKTSIPAVFV